MGSILHICSKELDSWHGPIVENESLPFKIAFKCMKKKNLKLSEFGATLATHVLGYCWY
jgi:hypothetical protein